MHFEPSSFYLLYTRGNQRGKLFFSPDNYLYFLRKARTELLPFADILAYCLMPNHYHFLTRMKDHESVDASKFARKIGTLQSSYTRAIQKERNLRGSLFQQKAKAKQLEDAHQLFVCFHYIHQNPLKAGLVKTMGEWSYSSFPDYARLREGTLINQELARKYIAIHMEKEQFISESSSVIVDDLLAKIFD
jgi:putative transposase